MTETESSFVRHLPCEKCGSSDANSLYTDGHTYCHVCKHYGHGDGESRPSHTREINPNLIQDLSYKALPKRALTEESCRKWNYGLGNATVKTSDGGTYNGPVQVATYVDADGNAVMQKVRTPDKDFAAFGDFKKALLYGQQLWRSGGKAVVITEGEIDAISVSQVQDHKWPVVSVPNGAKGAKKALQRQLEWLEGFESIVLMLDNDEEGHAAAKECIDLFTPGKVKIATLPLKDANEMLKAGRGPEIVSAFWNAKTARPDGIVAGTELWDLLTAVEQPGDSLPLPYPILQRMTRGFRRGELIMFAAGTGVGKSEVVRQLYTGFLLDHNETLGIIHLEESLKRTSLGMMGLYLKQRVHIDRSMVTDEQFREAYDKTVGSGKVYLYDHFGSADSDHLFAKIRYFAKGCGCTTIILDHISMVVSGIADGDERRIIDNLMTKLATMAQELNIRIIAITHLKKPEGTPHEEGGHVSLDDFRGSGTIKQLSHTCIGLERNQQDDKWKHYTLMRLLKCRHTGETGEADWAHYDNATGILTACAEPVFSEFEPEPQTKEPQEF